MTDEAVYSHAAVAAPHRLAADAGRDVLVQGGNAIEAMVAMAATIPVVYPHMNAIGGDGFWLIRDPKGHVARDRGLRLRRRARDDRALSRPGYDDPDPRAEGRAHRSRHDRRLGARAGTFRRARRQAAAADPAWSAPSGSRARASPVSPSEARFDPPRRPRARRRAGLRRDLFPRRQAARRRARCASRPRLADTLAHLAHAGLDDFYRGDIAREIAADLERIGSPVTRADLKAYRRALARAAVGAGSKKATLYNTPAPTQGLASLMLLGIYERLGVPEASTDSNTPTR